MYGGAAQHACLPSELWLTLPESLVPLYGTFCRLARKFMKKDIFLLIKGSFFSGMKMSKKP
jgi:hypothetical protein